jgi:hypothetical protein
MADRALDPHKLVKRLTDSGLSEQTAEVSAEALLYRAEDVATKQDLDGTRQELKADIEALRNELKADMNALRQELKADIHNVKVQTLAIMLPANAVVLTVVLVAFRLLDG